MTSPAFSNVPLVGPLLAATIGKFFGLVGVDSFNVGNESFVLRFPHLTRWIATRADVPSSDPQSEMGHRRVSKVANRLCLSGVSAVRFRSEPGPSCRRRKLWFEACSGGWNRCRVHQATAVDHGDASLEE